MTGLPDSLLVRTARGAGWVVAWRVLNRVLGIGSILVLVRLLEPADFALVALGTGLAVSIDTCLAIGVEEQIIRARDPQPSMYHTAFTLNLIRGLFHATLIAAAAAPAAAFFGDERLENIMFALAASAAINGLSNIGAADFQRHLQFEKEFLLQALPRFTAICAASLFAFLTHSHWALVIGIMTFRLGKVAMSYTMHPFRPRLSLVGWRDLAGVSVWSWAIGVASVLRDRADGFLIGRMLGMTPLGFYAVAYEVSSLTTSDLVDPICRACMPGFATALRGGDDEGLRGAYLRIVALVALLTIPMGIGVSLIAAPLIALAFGPTWADAAPVAMILAAACTTTLFGNVSGALLNAKAMLRTLFSVTAGAALLRVALLVVLVPLFGLVGAALAVGAALIAEQLVLVALALRLTGVRPGTVLARIGRPAVATAAMALTLWGGGLGWAGAPAGAMSAFWDLLAAVALGATVFVVAIAAMWRLAGSPVGAETDLLTLVSRVVGRLRMPRVTPFAAPGG